MKRLLATDAHSHNILRGTLENPKLTRESENDEMDLASFNKTINHPGPSQTTLNRFFPTLEYPREEFHDNEILFHITILQNSVESLIIQFDGCLRYPVTLGIDDQEINPGTFEDKEKGLLQGLKRPLSVDDIKKIGIDNVAQHIAHDNNFLTSVTEYRCTDLKGFMCSNAFTSFLSGTSDTHECAKALQKVAKLMSRCWHCLLLDKDCEYNQLYNRCAHCEGKGVLCVSLVVFNVLWDMASIHKSAERVIETIDVESNQKLFTASNLYGISFGGLHLCKCVVNAARCFSMSYQGENFGVYMLRALRNCGDKCAQML